MRENKDSDCSGVNKEVKDETGEFDDIFSDISDSDSESSGQRLDIINFPLCSK